MGFWTEVVDSFHDEGFSLPRSGVVRRFGLFRYLERKMLSSGDVPDTIDYCETPLANLFLHSHRFGRL